MLEHQLQIVNEQRIELRLEKEKNYELHTKIKNRCEELQEKSSSQRNPYSPSGFVRSCDEHMPNKHVRKTDRGLVSAEVFNLAADEVLNKKQSLRDAAKSYNICHVSLHRFIKKRKNLGWKKGINFRRLVLLPIVKC